jgi:D-alanyl-lipoteichoic acid acyltransferase DltB (MBOAT superfamily)
MYLYFAAVLPSSTCASLLYCTIVYLYFAVVLYHHVLVLRYCTPIVYLYFAVVLNHHVLVAAMVWTRIVIIFVFFAHAERKMSSAENKSVKFTKTKRSYLTTLSISTSVIDECKAMEY